MRYVLFIAVLATGYLTTSVGEAEFASGSSGQSVASVQSAPVSLTLASAEVDSTPLVCTPPPGCRCVGHTFICM